VLAKSAAADLDGDYPESIEDRKTRANGSRVPAFGRPRDDHHPIFRSLLASLRLSHFRTENRIPLFLKML